MKDSQLLAPPHSCRGKTPPGNTHTHSMISRHCRKSRAAAGPIANQQCGKKQQRCGDLKSFAPLLPSHTAERARERTSRRPNKCCNAAIAPSDPALAHTASGWILLSPSGRWRLKSRKKKSAIRIHRLILAAQPIVNATSLVVSVLDVGS